MTKLASPFSTGSGGADFERRVGAYFLATVLLRAVPRGQEAGIAREARFQQLYDNEPLDDLVVFSDLPVGETKLRLPKFPRQIEAVKTSLQIKRDLVFGEKDKTFDEVIRACWETLKSPKFHLGIDRFGIVIGIYRKEIDEHWQSVLTWARNSANATAFLSRVSQEKLSNKTQRDFVQLIKTKLDRYQSRSVSDDDIWNFLRSMVILHFDFHTESSRDYAYMVEMLSHLLPSEKKAEASHLFSVLGDYAADTNRTAGNFDSVNLRQKLQFSFALLPAPDCRGDLKRLAEHKKLILKGIQNNIGKLVLNRTDLVTNARKKMQATSLLVLVGLPGSGKSAILKSLVEMQEGESPALVFSGERLNLISDPGWNGVASHLRLTQELHEILVAVSSSTRPCIFIDGIDKITNPRAILAVKDLLRSLADVPLSNDDSKHWTLVVSAREESLEKVFDLLNEQVSEKSPEILQIPELKLEELQLVAQHCPRLQPILDNNQLERVLKNPFMLRILEEQQSRPSSETLPPVATEIEVSKVWWDKVVGIPNNSLEGLKRQRTLEKLGKRLIQSPTRWLLDSEDISEDIIISLKVDSILVHDPERDAYQFSHDLLDEWVLYRILYKQKDLVKYLQEIGQIFGLFRAVQLLGAFLLEKDEMARWMQLIEQLEQATDLPLKWRQALLTAPFISSRVGDLLDQAEPFLAAENAQRLIELLVALRTVEVNPDFLSDPVPRWRVWLPLMGWLLPRLNNLPAVVRPEAVKLMEMWQLKTPVGSVYRKEIGEIALTWLEQVERRNNHV